MCCQWIWPGRFPNAAGEAGDASAPPSVVPSVSQDPTHARRTGQKVYRALKVTMRGAP